MSVRLQGKWLWVRISLLSLKLQIWHLLWERTSLTFSQTIECRCTLKLVHDIALTYSQMHCTHKNSQHCSINWSVWLNGWVFVYKVSGCGSSLVTVIETLIVESVPKVLKPCSILIKLSQSTISFHFLFPIDSDQSWTYSCK